VATERLPGEVQRKEKGAKGSALTSLVCAHACEGARLRDGARDYKSACACQQLGHDGGPERRRTARQPKGPTIET
jgi:hypothetical protein